MVIHLPPELELRLERYATRLGISKDEVAQKAIDWYFPSTVVELDSTPANPQSSES